MWLVTESPDQWPAANPTRALVAGLGATKSPDARTWLDFRGSGEPAERLGQVFDKRRGTLTTSPAQEDAWETRRRSAAPRDTRRPADRPGVAGLPLVCHRGPERPAAEQGQRRAAEGGVGRSPLLLDAGAAALPAPAEQQR